MPDDKAHYLPVHSMNELGKIFGDIANSLIDRWQILRCYVAPARQGKVCWTFGKKGIKKVTPPKEPAKGRNIFLGINGVAGIPLAYRNYSMYGSGLDVDYTFTIDLSVKAGVDFAWPLSDKFAIGGYFNVGGGVGNFQYRRAYNSSIKIDNELDLSFDAKIGLLMLIGNINERPYILGISPCLGFENVGGVFYLPIELRLGKVLKEHLYLTGNLNIGVPITINGSGIMVEPSVAVGYHFGDKLKARK